MPQFHPRLVTALVALACPTALLACETRVASLVLEARFDEAAALFSPPDGRPADADRAALATELRRRADRAGATGVAQPITGAAAAGPSARLDIGYRPPDGATYRKATYAVASARVPGLRMNVLSRPVTTGCGVFAVQFETFDPQGMAQLQPDRR